jgi:hypothetical protein
MRRERITILHLTEPIDRINGVLGAILYMGQWRHAEA